MTAGRMELRQFMKVIRLLEEAPNKTMDKETLARRVEELGGFAYRLSTYLWNARSAGYVIETKQGADGETCYTLGSTGVRAGSSERTKTTNDTVIAKARLNEQGRLVIPAECREAAAIKPGEEILIEVMGEGELRLRTRAQGIRRAQEIVRRRVPKDRDLVAELIEDRRKEAARG